MSGTRSAAQWLDSCFNLYYRANPVSATFIGHHQGDDRLPTIPGGEAGTEIDAAFDELLAEIDSGRVAAPEDTFQALDLALTRGYLRADQLERQIGHLRRNPCWYTGEAIFGVVSLFLRDFAPLDDRLANAAARLRQVPNLFQAGAQTIERAPDAWVERAIHECTGFQKLLRDGVPILIERSGRAHPDLFDASAVALDAVGSFRDQLLQRATGPRDGYSVGEERFDLLLREAHQLDMSGVEIAAYARQELESARAELKAAIDLSDFRDWAEVNAALAHEHPSVEGYLGRFQTVWDDARQYAINHQLLTWPDSPIVFRPIPEWAQTAQPHLYFLFYRCPPPLDDGQVQRYLVPSLGPRPEEGVRLVTEAQITTNHVIHHAGIGHHVQNWHAARAASRIGQIAGNDCSMRIAMACGGTLVEGWACYATDLMAEAGYLPPLQMLSMPHSRMRMAARAIVDVELHAGRFSFEDAIAFYVNEADMSAGSARAEVVKNSMFPTMAMMYLIGTDLIHDLRTQMQNRWGPEFSLRRFHDEFLSYGAVPVSQIARLMRGEPLGPGGLSRQPRG